MSTTLRRLEKLEEHAAQRAALNPFSAMTAEERRERFREWLTEENLRALIHRAENGDHASRQLITIFAEAGSELCRRIAAGWRKTGDGAER